MTEKKLNELAKNAALIATKAGAKDARVFASRSRGVMVEWRDNKLDRIRESTKQGLYIELYVEGRYSGNATSDLRNDEVEKYVKTAVDMTRYLAPDKHRHLPDPSRYENPTTLDLEKSDPALKTVFPKDRLSTAKQLEHAARASDDKNEIISVTTSVSDSESKWVGFATNGFEATEHATSFSRSVSVSIADKDDRKPRGSSYGATRFSADLPSEEVLGPEALKRALGQIGSRQIATGRYELVIENRAVPTFARHLASPLSGGALQQKRSFLEGKLNQQIGSKLLTITSDPHLPRGLASTAWDDEGMVTTPRQVIEKGVLKTFFLNTYYASKLKMNPTTSSFSNLIWEHGKRAAADMVKSMKEGIYVTSFLGGNSNATTGDFSLGIKGFYVKDGKPVHPISEMNIAGNHLAFWNNLAEVGNDPWTFSSNQTPTLCFTDVQCSGSK